MNLRAVAIAQVLPRDIEQAEEASVLSMWVASFRVRNSGARSPATAPTTLNSGDVSASGLRQ